MTRGRCKEPPPVERFNLLPPDRRPDFWRWIDAHAAAPPADRERSLSVLTHVLRWRHWRDTRIERPALFYRLTGHDIEAIEAAIVATMKREGIQAFHVNGRRWETDGRHLHHVAPLFRHGCF